jgi:phasin
MAKDEKPLEDLGAIAGKTMEQARGAMESYFSSLQKSMPVSPWANTDLNKKIKSYTEQNIAAAFGFAQKLTQVKDLQELVRIQTEFTQTQLKSLGEQAKDLGEVATKTVTNAFKNPLSSSS